MQLELFDQEWWAPVVHFPNYEVSNLGRVRRCRTTRNWKAGRLLASRMTSGRGEEHKYECVDLYRDGKPTKMRVHRMVARAFIGPHPKGQPHVDHINADATCNAAWNLRWCSNAENQAYKNGEGESYEDVERRAIQDQDAEWGRDDGDGSCGNGRDYGYPY